MEGYRNIENDDFDLYGGHAEIVDDDLYGNDGRQEIGVPLIGENAQNRGQQVEEVRLRVRLRAMAALAVIGAAHAMHDAAVWNPALNRAPFFPPPNGPTQPRMDPIHFDDPPHNQD